MSPCNTYETERLILRPTNIDDAALVLEMLNMPKWIEYIGDRNVHSIEEAQAYIEERMLPQLKKLGFGNYTMIRKEDLVKLGTCGLYDREGLEGVDIGFALLTIYEKQGYAYEAASRVKQAGIEDFGITKISGITIQANTASQKLLEKLGLKFIKTMFLPDDPEELMLYEWNK